MQRCVVFGFVQDQFIFYELVSPMCINWDSECMIRMNELLQCFIISILFMFLHAIQDDFCESGRNPFR